VSTTARLLSILEDAIEERKRVQREAEANLELVRRDYQQALSEQRTKVRELERYNAQYQAEIMRLKAPTSYQTDIALLNTSASSE
jgi:hypothetical protein